VRVAIASVGWLPEEFRDDELLIAALGVRGVDAGAVPWDEGGVDWRLYDAVVIRSTASGRTAMVQPYLGSIDDAGETAIVFVDGCPSHGLRKRAVLTGEGIAPTRDDHIGAAEAMYDPQLVTAAVARDDELGVAGAIVDALARRFARPPLYARIDLARGSDGSPVLLELEAVEPSLYLGLAPGATERLADAIIARAART
jgi:hypothetical protein